MSHTMTMPMDMPSSTEGADSTMGSMPPSSMVMTFFTSDSTALFFSSWKPTSPAAYGATCVFLVVLAIILRSMLALKPILESSLWSTKSSHVRAGPEVYDSAKIEPGAETEPFLDTKDFARLTAEVRHRWSGWKLTTSLLRALFEVTLAIVGYFLMLAVMTYNIGYFLSVVAGIFIGTFFLGDLAQNNSLYQEQHC